MDNRERKIRFLSLFVENNYSNFENIRKFFSFLISIITAIGILFIFLYIIFVINWMPVGLSLSDTLGFLMLSVGLGFIFTAIYLPFYFKDLSVEVRFKSKKANEKVISIFLISLILFFQLFNYMKLHGHDVGLSSKIILIISFFWPSLLLLVAYVRSKSKQGKVSVDKKREILFISRLFSFFAVFYIFTEIGMWKNVTNFAGLTRQNVIIKLSSEQYKFAEVNIKKLNLSKTICTNKDEQIIFPVNILWRGIGNYSLIEVGEYPKNGFRIEVKNDESKIIYLDKNINNGISIKC